MTEKSPEIHGAAIREAVRVAAPDPAVPERPQRRRFTAKYKLEILRRADACREPGEVGRLLRQEGLYSSLLTTWRRQRDEGALAGLSKRRGRPQRDAKTLEIERLRRENTRLRERLEKSELVIEVQKKLSLALGLTLSTVPEAES